MDVLDAQRKALRQVQELSDKNSSLSRDLEVQRAKHTEQITELRRELELDYSQKIKDVSQKEATLMREVEDVHSALRVIRGRVSILESFVPVHNASVQRLDTFAETVLQLQESVKLQACAFEISETKLSEELRTRLIAADLLERRVCCLREDFTTRCQEHDCEHKGLAAKLETHGELVAKTHEGLAAKVEVHAKHGEELVDALKRTFQAEVGALAGELQCHGRSLRGVEDAVKEAASTCDLSQMEERLSALRVSLDGVDKKYADELSLVLNHSADSAKRVSEMLAEADHASSQRLADLKLQRQQAMNELKRELADIVGKESKDNALMHVRSASVVKAMKHDLEELAKTLKVALSVGKEPDTPPGGRRPTLFQRSKSVDRPSTASTRSSSVRPTTPRRGGFEHEDPWSSESPDESRGPSGVCSMPDRRCSQRKAPAVQRRK